MPHVSSFLHEAPGGVTDTATESSFGLIFADFGATLRRLPLNSKPNPAVHGPFNVGKKLK